MKVKGLIELLSKQDPEKEVMIQQGEEYDYMIAYSVKEKDLVDIDDVIDGGIVTAVVIEYRSRGFTVLVEGEDFDEHGLGESDYYTGITQYG